jgi:hypothetical protein
MSDENDIRIHRKRVEDVYDSLHKEVFPRLGEIDTKLARLENVVTKISIDGCPRRGDDLRRTQVVEEGMERIFEKIDDFGNTLSDARVEMVAQAGDMKHDVAKQISGIRSWVLTAVVILLLAVAGYFVKSYFDRMATHIFHVIPQEKAFFPPPDVSKGK